MAVSTIVLDITWVSDLVFENTENKSFLAFLTENLQKTFRIFRLLRLIKILKWFQKYSNEKTHKKFYRKWGIREPNRKNKSKVTQQLKSQNVKRIMVLIQVLLITIPLFSVDFFFPPDTSIKSKAVTIAIIQRHHDPDTLLNNVRRIFKDNDEELIELKLGRIDYVDKKDLDRLRKNEIKKIDQEISFKEETFRVKMLVSTRVRVRLQAILDLGQTTIVCILLWFSIYALNKDMSLLVLKPIDRILNKIKKMCINPQTLLKEKNEFDVQDENEAL